SASCHNNKKPKAKVFVDTAKIEVKAGHGGDGCSSLYKDRYSRYPVMNGGPGGNGGNVVIRANENIHTLLDFQYRRHFKAHKGENGSSNNRNGKTGEDCVIEVPVGTIVADFENGRVLRDLTAAGEIFIVAKGGRGGRGNACKKPATPGEPGEEKILSFELKLIADCGLLGFPNAGKSSLISFISKAKPKIAAYPFTTLQPVLGIVEYKDGRHFKIADIPGLIEGAHEGKGLGHKFLKHIDRTKVLVHIIDMAGVDGRDPLEDYKILNNELKQYGTSAEKKPQILVANKMDIAAARENLKRFKEKIKKDIIPISAKTGDGTKELVEMIVKKLGETK
ncbi:MAG: GTPase ObgE, partial [Candidatus Omnitrophica bacterium]|nr:GTPase ObgE [Candidatus Omnitrophota bacterium]